MWSTMVSRAQWTDEVFRNVYDLFLGEAPALADRHPSLNLFLLPEW